MLKTRQKPIRFPLNRNEQFSTADGCSLLQGAKCRIHMRPLACYNWTTTSPRWRTLYRRNDLNRSIWDVWCHALHHAAAIAERLRDGTDIDRVLNEIADFSLWLLTFVHKLSKKAAPDEVTNVGSSDVLIRIQSGCSDLVWHRYPGICPLCHARRSKDGGDSDHKLQQPCDCARTNWDRNQNRQEKRGAAEAVRAFSRRHYGEKPGTIDEWQEMFATLFRAGLNETSADQAILHLLEELGETSDAMARMYSYKQSDFVQGEPRQRQFRLESQIADVFSWLFALVDTLKRRPWSESGLGSVPTRLSEIIWRRYGSDDLRSFYCPFCEHRECECPLIFVPATRSMLEFNSINT